MSFGGNFSPAKDRIDGLFDRRSVIALLFQEVPKQLTVIFLQILVLTGLLISFV